MKALVIGGTGPTGPHVLEGLLQRGYEVTLLHRGVHEPEGLPDVEHIHADPHFAEPLNEALGSRSFDVVVATYGRVAEIAKVVDGRCNHLVAVGGMPVYPGCVDATTTWPSGMKIGARETDDVSVHPQSPKFAALMVAAESAVLDSSRSYIGTIMRYAAIYGPRNVIPWEWAIVKRVLDGRPHIILPDEGLAIISRCAAVNAAAMILHVIDHPELSAGHVYNCVDEEQFSLRQWCEVVIDALGADIELVGIPSAIAGSALAEMWPPGATGHLVMDGQLIRSQLGFVQPVPAIDAIKSTVDWLVQHPVTATEYPSYSAKFNYATEDLIIEGFRQMVDQMQSTAPDPRPPANHPMPHPKRPSLGVDESGR